MKLKNSYVLLMAMAIFLLISIGSVCASEDITADSDVLANADESVVLTNDIQEVSDDAVLNEETLEKTNTTITATSDKDKYEYNAEKNITVTVKDNETKNITGLNGSDFNITEGNNPVKFSYNNTKITILDKLTVGVHNLTIIYKGNETYNPSTANYTLKVYGNKTLEDVPAVVDINGTTVKIPARLTDGIEDYELNESNTNITYGNDNTSISGWTYDGKVITITNIATVPTNLTINYTGNGTPIIKKVQVKNRTILNITQTIVEINEGENATFTVTVYANGITKLNITKDDLTISKTGATNKFNETTGNLTLTGLKKGVYNITVTYKGNDVNNTSNGNVIINVRGTIEINPATTSVNVNSTKIVEIKINNITNGVDTFDFNTSNINITVSYKDGNTTKNITYTGLTIENNTIKITLENGNFTTATLTITYNETTTKNVTLNRIYNVKIIALNTENEYQDGNFTFKLVDVDDGEKPLANQTVSLYTTGNIRAGFSAKTNDSGIASFKTVNLYEFDQSGTSFAINKLEVGNHTVDIKTSGALKLKNNNTKDGAYRTNLTIIKSTINIVINPYKEYYGSDKKVKIAVTNANSGEPVQGIILHLYMPQTSGKDYYFQTNVNGTSEINVMGLVGGDYEMTVSNNDTKNINNASSKSTIQIIPIPVKIAITSSLSVYYNSGSTATIKITDKATGKAMAGVYVLVQLDKDKNYLFQTDSKGQISFAASLAVGKHPITVSTADNRYKGTSVSKTITVKKASATIKAPRANDYYKGVKYFTVKLINSKTKKAMYDAKLNIKVFISSNRYYNYNGRTGANGQIKLALDSLKPGTYKVVVAGADSKSFTAKQVTSKIVIKKAPTKLIPKKLTAKKGAKSYVKVTVKNYKTKKVIKGVKVKIKVYTGKKAKTYTAKTNSKGIAQISTSKLKLGKHKVIVTSANKYCVAKQARSYIKITR